MCADIGKKGKLPFGGSPIRCGAARCIHPGLFNLPPSPQFTLESVAGCALGKAAVNLQTSGGSSAVVSSVASPPGGGVVEQTDISEAVQELSDVGQRGADLCSQLRQRLGCAGGPGVEVSREVSEAWSQREHVVGTVLDPLGEVSEQGESLCGPGPYGARVRL